MFYAQKRIPVFVSRLLHHTYIQESRQNKGEEKKSVKWSSRKKIDFDCDLCPRNAASTAIIVHVREETVRLSLSRGIKKGGRKGRK